MVTARAKFSPKESLESVSLGIESAQRYLLELQNQEGFWCGELEGDTILESEYILTMYFLGLSEHPKLRKAANYIRSKALPEGGWAIYPGGTANVSASVKAYFALKLLGEDPNALHMTQCRETVLELGGIEAVNTFTRIYLALFGVYPWEKCPAVPPELVLIPNSFPVHIYKMSAWSRGIVVPLSIIWALRPQCSIPETAKLDELWSGRSPKRRWNSFWRSLFHATNGSLQFLEGRQWIPFRKKALAAAERWMLDHFEESDGIGAILPPIINSLIALHSLGYRNDDPVLQSQLNELRKLEIEEEDTLRVVPCYSPVWDTALAITALTESGLDTDHPAILQASDWILSKEVRKSGDWKVNNPEGQPGGWYFEFANELYPDVDDTFQVLIALQRVKYPDQTRDRQKTEAIDRAIRWLLTMQNPDGGWGSFDRECDQEFLTHVPFADHNAMIDPSTSDLTGRGLEALASNGFSLTYPAVQKAIRFLRKEQEQDRSWFGRWGCNYIYGTWLALRGLNKIGEDMEHQDLVVAAQWLRSVQNPDGGWGELPASYENPDHKGKGPSTPSQTGWGLMGLMATGDFKSLSLQKGIEYLLESQREDGSWVDEFWTGTGFPKVFYLRYHLYAMYFPLMALGIFEQHWRSKS